jgi:hypothetical protein
MITNVLKTLKRRSATNCKIAETQKLDFNNTSLKLSACCPADTLEIQANLLSLVYKSASGIFT